MVDLQNGAGIWQALDENGCQVQKELGDLQEWNQYVNALVQYA